MLELLLRAPAYESLTISPDGDYLAAQVPLSDRTVLSIVRRSDMKVTAQIDPGQDGFVDSSYWASPRTIFANTSMRFGATSQPYQLWTTYSLDVDGTNRRRLPGSIIDAIADDDEHVLVSDCRKVVRNACQSRVRKMRADGRGTPEDIVDAPVADAQFMVDRKGVVRFTWASDDEDVQKLYVREGDAWRPVNDEAASGVESLPIGLTYDTRAGFLWTQRKDGPDAIERFDLASGTRGVVAADPLQDPRGVIWSFDGNEPIGVWYGEGRPRPAFFDTAHPHVKLTRAMHEEFPSEFARVTSASRDGRTVIVTVSSDTDPGRYYLLDVASGELTLLAHSRPWLQGRGLVNDHAISMKARDGTRLGGYLANPGSIGSEVPLVVMPHGGPFGVSDQWGFDPEVQMLAAHGYAVLRVNFRGSGGYGLRFMEAGYREWGGLMQDDLTDATRWAKQQPGIDGSRVCIWGASYGAYAALMGTIREPDLYRCAIGMAGPYDLPTMYKWGDVQRSRWGKGWLKTTLGEDAVRLIAQSPSRRAGEIRAAILLVQGGRDGRVSPEHVRAMRRALDEAGKAYEGYFPAEETHGFFREKSRREYYTRVLAFLRQQLRGTGQAGGARP